MAGLDVLCPPTSDFMSIIDKSTEDLIPLEVNTAYAMRSALCPMFTPLNFHCGETA